MRNLFIKIGVLFFFLLSVNGFANPKEKADRHYGRMAYVKAIKSYEYNMEAYGDSSGLNNLAKSYVHLSKYDQAIPWFDKLFASNMAYTEEDVFFYVESLKASGRYKKLHRVLEQLGDSSLKQQFSIDREVLKQMTKSLGKFKVVSTNLNTPHSECVPVMMDKQLLFMSDRKIPDVKFKRHPWSGEHFYNLIIADVATNSHEFENVRSLSNKLNTELDEGPATYSAGQNRMIYSGTIAKKSEGESNLLVDKVIGNLQLLYSEYDENKNEWQEVQLFPISDSVYAIEHPTISADGNTLFFTSDHPFKGHQGGFDIYQVKKKKDGTWTPPFNLGDKVNTIGNEGFPYIHPSHKLFFASDGHPGFGKMDLFVSIPDEKKDYSETYNLGKPVNSIADDFGITLDDQLAMGYFSSDRPGGEGLDDIYLLEFIPELSIKGKVVNNDTQKPLKSSEVRLLDENKKEIQTALTDKQGEFEFDIKHKQKYSVVASKEYHQKDSTTVFEEEIYITEALVELSIIPDESQLVDNVEDGGIDTLMRTVLIPVNFDYNQFKIVKKENPKLNILVEILQRDTTISVEIYSYTDCRGSSKYNLTLSQKRADATRDYLLSQGVNTTQIIKNEGLGEANPLIPCDCSVKSSCTAQQHKINRRSEFVLKKVL